VSVDRLVDRIYWNPGEVAPSASARRPPSERLTGFFLVLPANVPVFEPALPQEPVSGRAEVAAIFGHNVRGARERRHITQDSLSRVAGLSRAGLSLMERGVCETTIETLLTLARALEVTPKFLLGGIAWKPQRPLRAPRGNGAQSHREFSLDDKIKGLWSEDKTAREIATVVGVSPGSVSAIVHRLRERGDHLAYRSGPTRAVHEQARRRREPCVAASDQSAAEVLGPAEPQTVSGDVIAARIGENVAFHRHRAGLTLEQLGEAIESDRTRIYQVEKGKSVPKLHLLLKLAASLNIRCEHLTAGITWEPSLAAFRVQATTVEPGAALKRLGENALLARRRVGISQQELSDQTSMGRGDVVGFEGASKNFRIFTAIKLAGALGIGFDELFAGVADWNVRPLPAPEYAPGDRPPTKSERDVVLIRLWREGRPEQEIANALGVKVGIVACNVSDLRDAGVHLPYRRPPRRAVETAARRRRDHRGEAVRRARSRDGVGGG
jgi:transcriptional regulator with XRE-family HTH domain